MPNTLCASTLWQFSLALYPKAQSNLLNLQDNVGANVNLLLLLCFLEKQQQSISQEALKKLSNTLNQFSENYTQPLRRIRRNNLQANLNDLQKNHLKQTLLHAELELEKLEQQLLIDNCPNLIDTPKPLLEMYLRLCNADLNAQQPRIVDLRQTLSQI